MNNPVLTAVDVRKTFISGDRRIEVLRGAALSVHAGESVSISGESGSGKSTLLQLLARLDEPDTGSITWGGSAERADYLGMVFQSFYLIPEMDALANVLMAARIRGAVGKAEKARAAELLARVGLAERATHLPAQLSGGERQRVAVARALMNNPKLILADEPTGNLDERTGEGVIELLLNLCRETETALVLVTHNAAHAARCARRLVLHEGVLS
jgi:predicted ABC-type transport system involved in lysophospholipase L1 biosynthesis ATPase subunit|uniref:ABC transporter ATP-binding protein n=1 Tax=Cephaloticoccus sp. TaxID=1985742 RepID=UPI00404B7B41